jgi:hypothetical protein
MIDLSMFDDEPIAMTKESGRWHARDVSYYAGRWAQLSRLVPTFELADFGATPADPPNPYMRAVIRQPRANADRPMPVGVVSNSYTLVQHAEVVARCFDGIRKAGVDPDSLRCELGLSELGEWMNLRAYFPDAYAYKVERDPGDVMELRLECFNSVDGGSRLSVLFGWQRLICTNGMVIGETIVDLRDVHDQDLTLDPIPEVVQQGLAKVGPDLQRLHAWERTPISDAELTSWVDEQLAKAWGVRAASRVLHICRRGFDAEPEDAFAPGKASEKPLRSTHAVPGSAVPARTLFHVSQALSWVATDRRDPDERVGWQRRIPELVAGLARR